MCGRHNHVFFRLGSTMGTTLTTSPPEMPKTVRCICERNVEPISTTCIKRHQQHVYKDINNMYTKTWTTSQNSIITFNAQARCQSYVGCQSFSFYSSNAECYMKRAVINRKQNAEVLASHGKDKPYIDCHHKKRSN